MDKVGIVDTLRAHEAELRQLGILHLSLFGSVANGRAKEGSDVDLMAELDKTKQYSLLSLVRMEEQLNRLLETSVDFSVAEHMKSQVLQNALREAIVAF